MRHPASGPHRSEFEAEEVERLAARARRPDRSSALEVVVETELTLLDPAGRLSYRGRDAIELARFRSFEEVVALLWDGAPPAPWELDAGRTAAIGALGEVLGSDAPDAERIPAAVARAESLGRRGYGVRRVDAALRAAGIAEADGAAARALAEQDGWAAALTFARKRRIGPFATAVADPDRRRRAIGAMLRAGHALDVARRIADARPGEEPDAP